MTAIESEQSLPSRYSELPGQHGPAHPPSSPLSPLLRSSHHALLRWENMSTAITECFMGYPSSQDAGTSAETADAPLFGYLIYRRRPDWCPAAFGPYRSTGREETENIAQPEDYREEYQVRVLYGRAQYLTKISAAPDLFPTQEAAREWCEFQFASGAAALP